MFYWKFRERPVIKDAIRFWEVKTGEVPYIGVETIDIEDAAIIQVGIATGEIVGPLQKGEDKLEREREQVCFDIEAKRPQVEDYWMHEDLIPEDIAIRH